MRWLASKRIAIKSIVLPGNFAATKAAARIADLATSLRETDGPIHLPIVRANRGNKDQQLRGPARAVVKMFGAAFREAVSR